MALGLPSACDSQFKQLAQALHMFWVRPNQEEVVRDQFMRTLQEDNDVPRLEHHAARTNTFPFNLLTDVQSKLSFTSAEHVVDVQQNAKTLIQNN